MGLRSWGWIGIDGLTPMYATVFGDLFLMAADGGVWFLDTVGGTLEQAAPDLATLQRAITEPAQRYLMVDLATACERRGILAAPGRVLSFRQPPVLGGAIDDPDNVEESDFVVCLNIMGQIHNQVRDLPPGTTIGKVVIEGS